uniref:Uncharacterized protein n=1 Tax=Candidatus Kentrum sp. LPFa TaxID=2126335 RepID=A0A450XN21_9GAMM|nr:MAG: hypothetical protein BECKLPF1236A_GA0070988_101186 [Candidatus Kentron sp. LPFa]VFK19318.1 MAG: hypothetical protein BECKLPF1236B_GA0070989_11688 [Candidatus Kentron sp. LPFa]VFK30743.1 MAG: hypothetical protein BECKLPF1236C_GA0070990_101185 [Candidatus Kentron sp. LPFa]
MSLRILVGADKVEGHYPAKAKEDAVDVLRLSASYIQIFDNNDQEIFNLSFFAALGMTNIERIGKTRILEKPAPKSESISLRIWREALQVK